MQVCGDQDKGSPFIKVNGRTAIELSEDVRHDEPVGWLVFAYCSATYDYKVFASERDAEAYAGRQAEESGRDWSKYPLYASHSKDRL